MVQLEAGRGIIVLGNIFLSYTGTLINNKLYISTVYNNRTQLRISTKENCASYSNRNCIAFSETKCTAMTLVTETSLTHFSLITKVMLDDIDSETS